MKKVKITANERIGLFEKFLDEFTDDDVKMKPCNPDTVFNWFINNLTQKP